MIRAAAALALVLCAACAGARADGGAGVDEAIVATWTHGRAGVPAGVAGSYAVIGAMDEPRVVEALEQPTIAAPWVPAVVVLHGCSGISQEERNLLYLLTTNGYAVLMPDSFARPGRQSLCDVANASAGVDPAVYRYREEELEYALARAREIPWLDATRIFALGFSEGGAAVARHARDDLAGAIVIGWHCHGGGVLEGLAVAPDTPVLALVMEDDPWYRAARGRHCGELFGDRPDSRSLILPGEGHSVLSAREVEVASAAKHELLRFLSRAGR